MVDSVEQRWAIKFCTKLDKKPSETHAMLKQAYGESAMSYVQVTRWVKKFKDGQEGVIDDPRSGRPSTSRIEDNVNRVRELLNSDRRLSVRSLADTLNIPKSSVFNIVTEELHMRKVCAKLVPKILSEEQKANRVLIANELLERVDIEPNYLDNVITGDETWTFAYDPETKRQSSEWHTSASPKPKKARMSKSKVKTMLIVFFDSKGVVHKEFLPQGQTVDALYYCDVLERLRKRVLRIRKDVAVTWLLHHDNAPSHTSLRVREYLAKHNLATLPQPPYSPDLSPPDFFLFPRIKTALKGRRFESIEDIQKAVTTLLNKVPVEAFQGAYQSWVKRWKKCVDANGNYFEEF